LDADRAALAANQKDRKKLEGDIQSTQQKISKLRDQMLEAKTNEQYRAFQNEITHFEGDVRKSEDRMLELMSESEPLDAAVKKAESALGDEKKVVDANKAKARERSDADKKELAKLEIERKAEAAKLPARSLRTYEHLRKRWHGSAVAEVVEGRCTGCQIVLRPQFYEDVRYGSDFYTCESCGRFLFYNPPVSVDEPTELAGESADVQAS